MKRSIPILYAEYGRYIDKLRAIPHHIDCLKPVERRLLLTLWSLAKNKNVKAARIIGEVLGKYHPHGDQSAYGSLVGLVQRGFAEGQGNWGAVALDDCSPAAMRYPEVKSNSLLNQLAFEFIKQVPWNDPENIQYDQPDYLPSPIPIGLIGEGMIQGISFHITKIPRYNITDLVKRLTYIFQKEVNPNTPKVLIFPQFKNCDVYEIDPGAFEQILTVGKGSIKVIPKMDVKPDGIHIYGKPPNGFSSLKSNADDAKKPNQRKYKIIDLTEKNVLDILIQPDNKIIDQPFIDLIFNIVSNNVHFECNVVDINDSVRTQSIDELLKTSYDYWVQAFLKNLNLQRMNLEDHLYELSVIEVIREILSNHNVKNEKELIDIFNKKYKQIYKNITDREILAVTSKHKIKTLLEFKINIQATKKKIAAIQNSIDNIGTVSYKKLLDMVPIN